MGLKNSLKDSLKDSLENSLKKIITYSTIALLSINPGFSNIQNFLPEKKLTITDYENISRIKKSLITEEAHYRKEYLKYIYCPTYKERLKKEMFTEETLTKEQQILLNKELKERKRRIKEVDIKLIRKEMMPSGEFYEPASFYEQSKDLNLNEGHKIVSLRKHIFHEFSHAAELAGFENMERYEAGFEKVLNKYLISAHEDLKNLKQTKEYQEYLEHKKELRSRIIDFTEKNSDKELYTGGLSHNELINFITEQIKKEPRDEYLRRELLTNEKGDPFEYMGGFTPEIRNELEQKYADLFEKTDSVRNELEMINYRIKYNSEYYGKNTEIKARLNDLRIRAIKNFNYDINKEFDINNFPELKNNEQYRDLKQKLKINDEGINELMKCTAQNKTYKTFKLNNMA